MTAPQSKYPDVPGSYHVGGSDEAAERMKSVVGRQHVSVLGVVTEAGFYGATSDEIAIALGWDKYAVRPRTAELRAARKIADSGRRRPSLTGIKSIVWVLPEHDTAQVAVAA